MLAAPSDRLEGPLDRFVTDLIRADGVLVEVQTGGFGTTGSQARRAAVREHKRVVQPGSYAMALRQADGLRPAARTVLKVEGSELGALSAREASSGRDSYWIRRS